MGDLILISGGARGADATWGAEGKKHGYEPVHYSFDGHKAVVPEKELIRLRPEMLRMANKPLAVAAQELERRWPPASDYTRKLFQRNWWQIQRTGAVYAVSQLNHETNKVEGGTGWAVQLYIDRNFVGPSLRLYVFDQFEESWYQYAGSGFDPRTSLIHWRPIELPPPPGPRFTGIGARELNEAGRQAIEGVFER